ncbi:MAG: creatininase family protein [Hyphomicrobium sp.]
MQRSRFVSDLTWDALRDALRSGAPAILPIGAGAKQHGFHLPLSTDAHQAEWFAVETAQRIGGLIWPTLTYGYYPAFADYAGSVSLQHETFEALAQDVLNALIGETMTSVVVIDTGISTIGSVRAAMARCVASDRIVHIPIYRGEQFAIARDQLMQQASGSHADEIETSIMLAMAPALVDMARAEASPARSGASPPGPLSPHDAASPNYAPSGSFGDPTLATAEKGRLLIAAILEDIDQACAQIRARSTN